MCQPPARALGRSAGPLRRSRLLPPVSLGTGVAHLWLSVVPPDAEPRLTLGPDKPSCHAGSAPDPAGAADAANGGPGPHAQVQGSGLWGLAAGLSPGKAASESASFSRPLGYCVKAPPAFCLAASPSECILPLQPRVPRNASAAPTFCRRKCHPGAPHAQRLDPCQRLASRGQQPLPAAHAAHDPAPSQRKLSGG